ncbi:MAG: MotA/TolQ/ExbB proton channel family protein [Synergistaceae bacterium]|nr:MotA/TolQ/ExbB proton channel family protein [Candidatus Equadaptatus faecalis]
MYEYMQQGGHIMWVIFAMSVIALAVTIERLIFFRENSTDAEALELAFGEAMFKCDRDNAYRVVSEKKSSLHRVFLAAYTHWEIDNEEIKLLVEQQVRREIYRWEKHLWLLELVARLSPLLGLLGTVLGMVEMFHSLNLGGQITGAAVTGGIYKALFTTVAGLVAAIPFIFIHGMLVSRIDSEEETLNRGADFIIMEHIIRTNEK